MNDGNSQNALFIERVPQVYQKEVELTIRTGTAFQGNGPVGLACYGSVKVAVLLSRRVSGSAPAASIGLTVNVSVPPGIQR